MTQTKLSPKRSPDKAVRVLICEDEPVFSAALSDLFASESSLELVGRAQNADEAIEIATREKPDVALVDVRMPRGGGRRATREICALSPETKVLALSAVDRRDVVFGMLRAGAVGYILKGVSPEALVGAVVNAANGQAILSRSVTADVIEELVRLLNQSEDFSRELEALDRTKSELVQVLSHELRTPVTVIHAAVLTLTKLGIELSADQIAEISASVTNSTSKLRRLAGNVSAAAGLGAEGVKIAMRPVSVSELLGKAIAEFPHQEGALRCPSEGDEETSSLISANVDLANRALVLVIENALEMSPLGSQVEVRVERNGANLEILVLDRGTGIPDDLKQRIFEPFVQVDSSTTRTHPGLGIGLYLARRIMSAHGGGIEVSSRAGGGSVFVLKFQVAEPS